MPFQIRTSRHNSHCPILVESQPLSPHSTHIQPVNISFNFFSFLFFFCSGKRNGISHLHQKKTKESFDIEQTLGSIAKELPRQDGQINITSKEQK